MNKQTALDRFIACGLEVGEVNLAARGQIFAGSVVVESVLANTMPDGSVAYQIIRFRALAEPGFNEPVWEQKITDRRCFGNFKAGDVFNVVMNPAARIPE